MTDREKLIEVLIADPCGDTDCDTCELSAHADCYREQAADYLLANGVTFATDTNDGGKWIPVTERLPEYGESVLVCDAREDYVGEAVLQKGLVFMGKEFQGCWDWKGTSCRLDEFTHWMPLPELPKEG